MATIKLPGKWHPHLHPPSLALVAALSAVYLIWGSSYLATALALEDYPPFLLTALRTGVSAAILLVTCKLRKASMPPARELFNAGMTGAMIFAGAGLIALGQQMGVSSGLASLAVAAVAIWATLMATILGYRPSQLETLGLALGIVGVALLNLEKGMQANPAGALMLLIGPMMWALGSVISSRLKLPAGVAGVAFQMAGGFVALLLISWLRGEAIAAQPSALATAMLLYLALVGTLVAFSAYMYLVGRVRPALATSYAYVNPVIAVMLGAWLLSEPLTGTGALAMLVIVAGVLLVMIGKRR